MKNFIKAISIPFITTIVATTIDGLIISNIPHSKLNDGLCILSIFIIAILGLGWMFFKAYNAESNHKSYGMNDIKDELIKQGKICEY